MAVLRAAALRALRGVMVQCGTRLPAKGGVLFYEREKNTPFDLRPRVQRTESRRSALWALMSCLLTREQREKPSGISRKAFLSMKRIG